MGDTVSPLGWTLIILFGVFIVVINISLFLGFKKNRNRDTWIDRLTMTGKKVRDPFKDENDKIRELSLKVESLRQHNLIAGKETEQNSGTGAENEH